MRRKACLSSLLLLAIITGCGSADSFEEGDPCGPNGECPSGYECEPNSKRCFRVGAFGADARVTGAIDAAPGAPDANQSTIDAGGALAVTLTKTPPARTRDTVLSFEFTGGPAGATFQCKLDQAAYAACTSPASVTTTEGMHTFSVVATLGGQTSAAATSTFTVDTTGPPVTIDSGPTSFSGATATFTYSAEPGSRFECSFDPAGTASFSSCPASGIMYENLINGQSYTFRVRALDDVGNPGAPAIRTFTADTLAPAVILTFPTANLMTGTPVTPVFAADPPETGVVFECDLGQGFVTCVSGVPLTYPEGPAKLSVRARDKASNVGPVTTVNFTVSTAKTTVTITEPAPDALVRATVMIKMTSTNAFSFTCTIDGSSVGCAATGATVGPLLDGKHTFTVVAHGSSGDSDPASVSFFTDSVAPGVNVTLMSAADNSGVGTFNLVPTEKLSALVVTVDGLPCSLDAKWTLATCSFLSPGSHHFAAVATDMAGNVGSPDSVDFSMIYGPARGHLTILGFGYRTVNAQKTRILGNALAQSPVASLTGFSRPLRVLFYDAGAGDGNEKANVRGAMSAGLAQHNLTFDEEGSIQFGAEPGDQNLLATKLIGRDVMVIYNQGNAGDLTGPAAAFAAPMQAFLDVGGIVLVTDGWYGTSSKTASQSFKVIAPSLLDIASSSLWAGGHELNPWMVKGSLDSDPLAAGVGATFPGDANDPSIAFLVGDPKAVRVYYTMDVAGSVPVVLDKVFPEPKRGPATVRVESVTDGFLPAQVVFQGADGSVQKGPFATDAQGMVVGSVDDGGLITVTFDPSGDTPTHVAETVFGARPYDDLKLGVSFDGGNQQNPQPMGQVQIDLPDHMLAVYQTMPATRYAARVICDTSGSDRRVQSLQDCGQNWMSTDLCTTPNDQGFWTLDYFADCLVGGKLDVMLEARDASNNIIGMQLLLDVPTSGQAAASWTTSTTGPDYVVTLTNPPAGGMGAVTSVFFRLGQIFAGGDGTEFALPFAGPATYGAITPATADAAGDLSGVKFDDTTFSVLLHANFAVSLASRSINLASELLPRVTFTLGGTTSRPSVTHAPTLATSDGASAILTWNEVDGQQQTTAQHFWGLIFPPAQSTVTLPLMPAGLSSYLPGAPMTTPVQIGAGIVLDSSLYADYDDWINQYWFPQALPRHETSPFTFRSAVVGQAQIYLPFFN